MKRAFITGGSGFLGRHLIADLRKRNVEVRALARSDEACKRFAAAGAQAVPGDISDVRALQSGMESCDLVFHAAAIVRDWGNLADFQQVNVQGTVNVLEAAKAAKVNRFVHVSSEAVLAGTASLQNIDEKVPLPAHPLGPYATTKGLAEKAVLSANTEGFATIVVRPRFVWGKGDTSVLPQIVEAVQKGTFRWIAGGRYLTSTTHVENATEALILAAEKGRPGEIYFATDGAPVEFRAFISQLLKTQGIAPPTRSVPRWLARTSAAIVESIWPILGAKGAPPATRMAVKMLGEEVTISDAKARAELGYSSHIDRDGGLSEMSAAQAPA